MSNTWQEFASYSDAASAEAVAGLLRSEGVPTEVIADQPIPGLVKSVRLCVPSDLMHRAKWVTSKTQLTEAELVFLATGKLEGNENGE
jgi:negative regulator of sigma E activity